MEDLRIFRKGFFTSGLPSGLGRVVDHVPENESSSESDGLGHRPFILVQQLFGVHELEGMSFDGMEGRVGRISRMMGWLRRHWRRFCVHTKIKSSQSISFSLWGFLKPRPSKCVSYNLQSQTFSAN